ncbi:unnamed protein product [Symbiodinium pilosum]|uniref:SnoaL-like domain-containing protein n=1 Tax=Symbiodinium pilosum TaxID=2952 RepID=A0A812SNG8_SYMPI|nr:unnamed protein product [Symbiodinium pilosum]
MCLARAACFTVSFGAAWLPVAAPASPAERRAAGLIAVAGAILPGTALAEGDGKRRNLAAAEVAKTVRDDLVNRQFLATADFSPEIYDESCTFTDEIDTYQKDKFIKGTKALFVASESNVQLVGDVDVIDGGKKLQFRFQETLAFNFPIVHPKVTLSGTCTLTRGEDGLIVAYREKWDQSVPEVLSTARPAEILEI